MTFLPPLTPAPYVFVDNGRGPGNRPSMSLRKVRAPSYYHRFAFSVDSSCRETILCTWPGVYGFSTKKYGVFRR